ncbi:hypothetical protein [Thermosediminibacter oceani]|uniref:Uncharacterized protein n=1 Tax=Thermosediminibacter oceani (strain ATCC BAA-1034 / DSM 16646 / JW/IW-1228P) TaxID=555079 RepID=D9S3M6_THEOJ|nr:hypothetical protein [Thermosediminibacter oceani]ADL08003.1 hypothetical protein Toce_1247 [Thermosediminibacter oceani DSM 16646]
MENKNILLCEHCGRVIESKDDLVVVFYFLTLSAYHNECFGKGAKNNPFLSNVPINGNISNIGTIFLSLLSIVMLLISPVYETKILFSMMAIIWLLIRIYAWFKYESIFD